MVVGKRERGIFDLFPPCVNSGIRILTATINTKTVPNVEVSDFVQMAHVLLGRYTLTGTAVNPGA